LISGPYGSRSGTLTVPDANYKQSFKLKLY
jgi:hypothetical protein